AGTYMVMDINDGAGGSDPQNITVMGGWLYFSADDGVHGRELWCSDGTPNDTYLVKDINTQNNGADSSAPGFGSSNFAVVGGTLFFVANDGTNGYELWKSDGTANGTSMVRDIFPGNVNNVPNNSLPRALTPLGGMLLFSADDGATGRELWKSDGT